jgi:uncharacterized protein (DUF58 family)
MATSAVARRLEKRPPRAPSERSAWRNFAVAIGALAGALLLALYSSAAAQTGRRWLGGILALAALAVAGWVTVTIVPALARRTALRWFASRVDYGLTREGVVYMCGILVVSLAALNTGNNLLFVILSSLLAGILISGVLSHVVLSGVELRLELPEHIFAGRPVLGLVELVNHKLRLPSFSLRLVAIESKSAKSRGAEKILPGPVYFPFLPSREAAQQNVELTFPHRGVYRQDSLGLRTKFPFGFLEKTRRVESSLEAVVYPSVESTEEFYEILPLVNGELESFLRGRGHDLYAIRDYQTSDTARHIDWKASAKTGVLQVREFTREDERRVLLVLDPFVPPARLDRGPGDPAFERGVALCASLAWHFYELDSVLAFRSGGFETPMSPAGESIYDILRYLAVIAPDPTQAGLSCLDELSDLPHVFKIILTRQLRGSIPPSLWGSSFILFLDS